MMTRSVTKAAAWLAPVAAALVGMGCGQGASKTGTAAPETTQTTTSALGTEAPLPGFVMKLPKRGHVLGPNGCPNLTYYGGPIISHPNVVQVYWSSQVSPTTSSFINGWWPGVIGSNYLSLMTEYSTVGLNGQDGQPGSNQTFQFPAVYVGPTTITPSIGSPASLDDSQIQTELASQIAAGSLPPPTTDATGNVNTIYMIDFPPAITSITLTFGGQTIQSCVQFCGYHFATTIGGKVVPYAVLPDLTTGACNQGCSMAPPAGTADMASVHSHELSEAMTDLQIAETNGSVMRPMAWFSDGSTVGASCSEIGDLCNFQEGTVTFQGQPYPVQAEWSNMQNACVTGPAAQACTTNAQCANPTPICTAGVCSPCTTDTQCTGNPQGNACSPGGSCVQCTSTNMTACVAPTPKCDTTTNTCVACTTNSDCSGGTPICDTGTHMCRACMASDCTSPKPICETSGGHQGQCVQCDATMMTACTAPTPKCDTTTDTCVGCLSNSDCSGGTPICDMTSHSCRACTSNADCAGMPNPACATGMGDPNKGKCVQCASSADCMNPKPVCSSATDTCGACATNADCTGNSNGPACVPSIGCVKCATNSDCPNGGTCDTTTHTCSGGSNPDGGGSDSGNPFGGGDGGNGNPGSADGGPGGTTTTSCSCRVGAKSGPSAQSLAGLLLGLALFARRRTAKS